MAVFATKNRTDRRVFCTGKRHGNKVLRHCLTSPQTDRQLPLDELTLLAYLNISINLNTSRPVTSYFHDR
ncbi:hypothetical protein RHE_CH01117 [Rhizobium etli CFN 42]|uniref:Uncharacterized protein n=1 Tax=Rhizobium etli (strain ATCC 51251 / DSM 11541 / JCM 21823 / NBRC 15573 / CFN 42) TaxID=347834 RepID=Q2KB62_RHIEC|nr:hypothetical protein RHE_CH01117 [Rhizobium etli CFN 42]